MSAKTFPARRGRPPAAAEPPAGSGPNPEPAAGTPFPDASPEARRLAAAILEVLAGSQLPSEAAGQLGISLPRYYQLELRAIAGLVAACERRRPGRGPGHGEGVAALQQECERLRRECARQQALVRVARRTVGLAASPPPPPAPEPGRKRRRRRPTARALKMAALLQPPDPPSSPAESSPPGNVDRPPDPVATSVEVPQATAGSLAGS
jgi:hypothetical protein